jgi:hypothetical protein
VGLQSELENQAERDQQTQEECDREQMSHSFSPLFSIPKRPTETFAPWPDIMFVFCSLVKGDGAVKARKNDRTLKELEKIFARGR